MKIDRLQLINASARYQLLSANQQLLDFHLSRIMQSKLKQKTQKKKILNENTQVSNDHGNMLKTITEEPVLKEGKCEAREARGPKPLMIKK
jgi:hypothetical protein